MSLLHRQRNSFLIEGNKCLSAHPTARIGNRTIRKIPAGPEYRQARLQLSTVGYDIWSVAKQLYRSGDGSTVEPVIASQYPDKLAQAGQRYNHHGCGIQNLICSNCLRLVVANGSAKQNVGVHRNIQS